MSEIIEKGSLALSALDINKYIDKSISDEILLDKETGLFYYNIRNADNENAIDCTFSIDLASRVSYSINKINDLIDKNGGLDYEIYNLFDLSNATGKKPILFKNNFQTDLSFSTLSDYMNSGEDMFVYVDGIEIRNKLPIFDISPIPANLLVEITKNENENTHINPKTILNEMNIYSYDDIECDGALHISIQDKSTSENENRRIAVFGIYIIILK